MSKTKKKEEEEKRKEKKQFKDNQQFFACKSVKLNTFSSDSAWISDISCCVKNQCSPSDQASKISPLKCHSHSIPY